jgi:PHD/YefM family antitoxin component YafN of YafNO toxin-antitoxin module
MQTVTASQIKQNSTLLQNALRDDLLVTKRDKPYVVVLDYQRYQELLNRPAVHTPPPHTAQNADRPLTRQLAGIFADTAQPEKYDGDVDAAIDAAYHQTMMEKYGHTDA